MSRRKLNMPMHERVLRNLRKEHEGITDYIAELEPYVLDHPDDKPQAGQLKYFKSRLTKLSEIIAQHENREATKID